MYMCFTMSLLGGYKVNTDSLWILSHNGLFSVITTYSFISPPPPPPSIPKVWRYTYKNIFYKFIVTAIIYKTYMCAQAHRHNYESRLLPVHYHILSSLSQNQNPNTVILALDYFLSKPTSRYNYHSFSPCVWSVRHLPFVSQHGQWDICHLLHSMVSETSVICFTAWSVRHLPFVSQYGQWDVRHLFHSMVSETSIICFTAWSVRCRPLVSQHGQWEICHLFHSMVSEMSATCFTAWSVRCLSSASQHGQWDICHLFHSIVNEMSVMFHSMVSEMSVTCFTAWSVRHLSPVSQHGQWEVWHISQHGQWDVCYMFHSMVSEASVTCFTAWSVGRLSYVSEHGQWNVCHVSQHGQWDICHLLHSMVSDTSVTCFTARSQACKCSHAMHKVMWCEEMWLHWSAVLLSASLSLPRQPDTSPAALWQVPSHDCPASSTPSATQTTLLQHRQQFFCNTDNSSCATQTVEHRQQFLWNTDCGTWTTDFVEHLSKLEGLKKEQFFLSLLHTSPPSYSLHITHSDIKKKII